MNYYQIADAAKKVNVESHVLRYWEEELQLPIERNKQGHRLYTDEDLSRFLYIKELKKEGLQLRAIRTKVHMRDEQLGLGKQTSETGAGEWEQKQKPETGAGKWEQKQKPETGAGKWEQSQKPETSAGKWEQSKAGEAAGSKWSGDKKQATESVSVREAQEKQLPKCKDRSEDTAQLEEEKTRKAARLCMMLQQMVVTAVHEENEGFLREIKKGVAETVSKEMNYQFSIQEQREEEHYKKLDEILRERERRNRMTITDRKRMKKERQREEKEKQRAEKEKLMQEQQDARKEKERLKQEQEEARRKGEKARQESMRREKERLKKEKENARREKEKVKQMKAREAEEKKQPRESLFGAREKNSQEQRA